jgi:hypothetical protein
MPVKIKRISEDAAKADGYRIQVDLISLLRLFGFRPYTVN